MRLSSQTGVGAGSALRARHRPPRVHLAVEGPEAWKQASGTVTYTFPKSFLIGDHTSSRVC